jgi:hypothetical protein
MHTTSSPKTRRMMPLGALALVTVAAACTSVLGVEPWKDPLLGRAPSGSGGSDQDPTVSSGGAGGAPGTGGAGGAGGGADAGDPCALCRGRECAAEEGACADDEQCQHLDTCLLDSATCCIEHDLGPADDASSAVYACVVAKCSAVCAFAEPSCHDCFRNGQETDVDCGGACAPCASGKACATDGDCESAHCLPGGCDTGPCCE